MAALKDNNDLKRLSGGKHDPVCSFLFVESPASTRVTRNSGKQPTILSMFSKVCVYHSYFLPDTFLFTSFNTFFR